VFIPKKLDKWGNRFGFVKFLEVKDEEALGARLEDASLWNTHLKVNRARFGRESNKVEVLDKKVEKWKKKEVEGGSLAGPSVLPDKSFKAAVSKDQSTHPCQGEPMVSLEVTPSVDMLQMLECCFVGELVIDQEAEVVQVSMVMKGISQVKVINVGVGRVLLNVEDQGDIFRFKNSHLNWWNATFKSVKRWSPERFGFRRKVWLNVFGIPLHVWDEPQFKLLGSSFGTFLDFDEATIGRKHFDMAKINVLTDKQGIIDEKLILKVMGAEFTIWAVKEGASRWGSRKGEGERKDDVTSLGSCDGGMVHGGGGGVF
jgi:hypothetical protein